MYSDIKRNQIREIQKAKMRAETKDIRDMCIPELQIEVATLRERCAQLEIRLREKQPTYSAENIKCSNNTNEFGEPNVR